MVKLSREQWKGELRGTRQKKQTPTAGFPCPWFTSELLPQNSWAAHPLWNRMAWFGLCFVSYSGKSHSSRRSSQPCFLPGLLTTYHFPFLPWASQPVFLGCPQGKPCSGVLHFTWCCTLTSDSDPNTPDKYTRHLPEPGNIPSTSLLETSSIPSSPTPIILCRTEHTQAKA